MKVNQIFNVLNDSMRQVWGEENVTATDLQGLVNEGNLLLNSDNNERIYDSLYKALLGRIYKIIIGERRYTAQANNIIRDYETYGSILEKIYFEPITATSNGTYELVNGESIDPFKVSLNQIRVKLFTDSNTWEVPFTIQEKQIRQAFTGEYEMGRFINGIYLNADNSLEAQIEKVEEFTIAHFIAKKIQYANSVDAKGIHVLNLLKMYNTITSSNLTEDNCLYNKEFLRFASATINKYCAKFERYTTVYNTEQYKRFTPSDKLRLMFLNDFTKQLEMYLDSDTFHESFVKLPNYSGVSYWQGSGTEYDTKSCSTINVVTDSGDAVNVSGVIGMAFDIDALGVTMWDKRTTSQYNGRGEYNNYWLKCNIGLYNDLSENAIVFTITNPS